MDVGWKHGLKILSGMPREGSKQLKEVVINSEDACKQTLGRSGLVEDDGRRKNPDARKVAYFSRGGEDD